MKQYILKIGIRITQQLIMLRFMLSRMQKIMLKYLQQPSKVPSLKYLLRIMIVYMLELQEVILNPIVKIMKDRLQVPLQEQQGFQRTTQHHMIKIMQKRIHQHTRRVIKLLTQRAGLKII